MPAVLTPRVRIMAICDGVRQSRIDPEAFDLQRVRQVIRAPSFPFTPRRLWLHLLLSCHHAGEHQGYVLVSHNVQGLDRYIFRTRMAPNPVFGPGQEFVPQCIRIRCTFPQEDRYYFQVCFYQHEGSDVIKGEFPFDVMKDEA